MKRFLLLLVLTSAGIRPVPAALLYDNTTDTGVPSFANLDAGAVILDDVPIPIGRLNGGYKIDIKRMTADIYTPLAGTYSVRWWYSLAKDGGMGKPTVTLPPTFLATQSVTTANNERKTMMLGNNVTTLLTANLFPVTLGPDRYGLIFIGLSFSANLNGIGWATAKGPDTTDNTFYGYYGSGDVRNGFKTLGGGPGVWASFNLKINGEPVPEPGTIVVLSVGCLALFRLRRR